jgi:hypothetical protein
MTMSAPLSDPADAAAQLADAMRALGQAAASGPFEVEVRVRVVSTGTGKRELRERLRAEQARQERLQIGRERTELVVRPEGSRPGLGRSV